MLDVREQVEGYVKRVKDLAEHVKGNEQATKQSLIGPFFTLLGYDLTDPRECIPEYRADFGKDRSAKPIDWAFLHNGSFAFFVEAKEVGRKLAGFDEQLADYFAKDPNVKLGILTNGAQWRFFTDIVNSNVMDQEPFARWDVFSDEGPPIDVVTILAKAKFNPELIRAYAQRQRERNLLVGELTRLLEPASEFTKLAIANVETRNLTQAVVESWKPIVASALNEWSRQRMLTAALSTPAIPLTSGRGEPAKIETSKEELEAFEAMRAVLGEGRPIEYDDSVAYFKVHVAGRRTWVIARLQLSRRQPLLWVPLPADAAKSMTAGRTVSSSGGWSGIAITSAADMPALSELLCAAYLSVKDSREGAAAEE